MFSARKHFLHIYAKQSTITISLILILSIYNLDKEFKMRFYLKFYNVLLFLGIFIGTIYSQVIYTEPVAQFQLGYGDMKSNIAISPDGKIFATGSSDIFLWDFETGNLLKKIIVDLDSIISISFSHDGTKLLIKGPLIYNWQSKADVWTSPRLFDVETGQYLGSLPYVTNNAIFSDDDKKIIYDDYWKGLGIWDIEKAEIAQVDSSFFRKHVLAILKDGSRVITSYYSDSIWIWDMENEDSLLIVDDFNGSRALIKFSPIDNHILIGAYNSDLKIYDYTTGSLIKKIGNTAGTLNYLAYTTDGLNAIASYKDSLGCIIKLINLKSNEVVNTYSISGNMPEYVPSKDVILTKNGNLIMKWDLLSGDSLNAFNIKRFGNVTCMEFSPDDRNVVIGASDSTVKILDIVSKKFIKSFNEHTESIVSVQYSPDGSKILSLSKNEVAILWDISTGKSLQTYSNIRSIEYSPDGSKILSLSRDGVTKLWDISTSQCLKIYNSESYPLYLPRPQFSPNGETVFLCLNDSTGEIWDINSNECIKQIKVKGYFTKFKYSPDGDMFLTVDPNGLKIWSFSADECVKSVSLVGGNALYSPDGKSILMYHYVYMGEYGLKLFDVETETSSYDFGGPNPGLFCFSDNGASILVKSSPGVLNIFNTNTLEKKIQIIDYKSLSNFAISKDRSILIAACDNGTMSIWELKPEVGIIQASKKAKTTFSLQPISNNAIKIKTSSNVTSAKLEIFQLNGRLIQKFERTNQLTDGSILKLSRPLINGFYLYNFSSNSFKMSGSIVIR